MKLEDDVNSTTDLMKSLLELQEDNRILKERAREFRTLARLASVISMQEGFNLKYEQQLADSDRKYEALMNLHTELLQQVRDVLARQAPPS